MNSPWGVPYSEDREASRASRELTLDRKVLQRLLAHLGAKDLLLRMKGELTRLGAEDTTPTLAYFLEQCPGFPARIVTAKLDHLADLTCADLLKRPARTPIHRAYVAAAAEGPADDPPVLVFDWIGVSPLVAVHTAAYLDEQHDGFLLAYSAHHGQGTATRIHAIEPFDAWVKRLHWTYRVV